MLYLIFTMLLFFVWLYNVFLFLKVIFTLIRKRPVKPTLKKYGMSFIPLIILFVIVGGMTDTDKNKSAKHTSQTHQEEKDKKQKNEDKDKDRDKKGKKDDGSNSTSSEKESQSEHQSNHENKQSTSENLIAALFVKHIDGDTSKFNIDGKIKTVRYLLIDTPETKHPRLGVQPFGKEASNRTKSLLSSATKIEIEYDVGPKTDKYGRDLAYVFVDGKLVNEILVREGLAKVAYVYPPNTKYLERLQAAEALAKQERLGIWSEQTDTVAQDTASVNTAYTAPQQSAPNQNVAPQQTWFKNCTELNKVYPGGVPLGHPAYQRRLDRNHDGHACEAH